jgi:hypothetical protein
MAFVALNGRVRAEQWEAILVIAHLLHRDLPTADGMALRAIRTHLAAMNVCMTIGAAFADIGEDGLRVALYAFHFFVHAAKRVLGLVMVELGDRADGAPTR